MLDSEGNPENLAGAHPDRLQVDFALDVQGTGTTARDLVFELPPGLGGDPSAVPRCPRAQYESAEGCPPESQVGVVTIQRPGLEDLSNPVFELEPEPGEFFAFGSKSSFQFPFESELRPADFGLTLRASELPQQEATGGSLEFWGVPADHQDGGAAERRPFLSAPATCGPVVFTLRVRSWEDGAPWLSESTDTGAPLEECETLGFAPRLTMQLSNPVADSPTGLRLDMLAPEEGGPDDRANAPIENATIALPAGITVSPGGAQHLSVCSDAQFGLGNGAEPLCPASSRAGTAEFASSAIGRALTGSVYLGEAQPGQRLRFLIAAPGPKAMVKFASSMRADPATGRLTADLVGLPQIPVDRLGLSLGDGGEPLLASPLTCGAATATARFEPYGGGVAVRSSASVAVTPRSAGVLCPGAPFAPRLTVRSSPPRAGRPSSFSTSLIREDGELLPRRFSFTLPAGLSAALGSVQACDDAAVAAAACPPASMVGEVVARAGSGPNPAALHGDAYVTGPYRHAPFGLLMQLRAAIGPFDLGSISMRAAVGVDARTGRVTVTTDPLPEAVEGIPVRFQSIELSMNRPNLVRNPTSCGPHTVDATVEAGSGASASTSAPLALHGCRRLPFRPHFHVVLSGDLRRGGKPDLRVAARFPPGDTGLRSLEFSLPRALGFSLGGLREICSRQDARTGNCPPGSRVGIATAVTPVLKGSLRGGLYVVQPDGNGLPDLWVLAAAQGVEVELRGRAVGKDGQMVTKLAGLPDMPLSRLTMRLGGRDGGILSSSSDLCRGGKLRRLSSEVLAIGQNGLRRRLVVPIGARPTCGRATHGR
jgi:hypothetical protein